MGSVDLTHVSGASSTREVPYARFYLVVIYGAGTIPQLGRSWGVDDTSRHPRNTQRPISVDGFAASTIKFKARQLVPHAGTTTVRLMSSRPDATEIDTGFHASVAMKRSAAFRATLDLQGNKSHVARRMTYKYAIIEAS
ncbi:hypothetical protein ALC62_12514 [Cyphomyrmex costatus]|uniref:Uncharacterized protein n=1 Tax=Cyphomyrmex costatus TaxID=456900 RepID=A0A195C7A0_9HYME|nr:hypothetical protein ALC62_12514 [Cyphomyrmex costatus]